jgi:hypothetical protein
VAAHELDGVKVTGLDVLEVRLGKGAVGSVDTDLKGWLMSASAIKRKGDVFWWRGRPGEEEKGETAGKRERLGEVERAPARSGRSDRG